MPATPPPANPAPESATTALYRAALGPVNTASVLRVFERFDEAGRASPVWNPAAAFLTLNWMAFRQLWGAALVYLLCVVGVLLVVVGFGRSLLQQWPPGVVWGMVAAMVLLSVAIPGAYGHALLHADVRRRMTRAVREASTLREACATLAQQASGRRRLWVLALVNAVLVGAVAGALLLPGWRAPALSSEPVASAAQAVAAREAVVAPEPTPEPAPQARPEPPAEPTPVAAVVPQAGVQPQTAADLVVAAAPLKPMTDAAPVPRAVASEPAPVAIGSPPATPSRRVGAQPQEPEAKPSPRVLKVAPTASAPSDEAPQAHGVNVGLFAERANAEKAQARLADAGFVAILQTVERPNGELTRVRVGPFPGRAQADEAAARIRALGLDAVVFRP